MPLALLLLLLPRPHNLHRRFAVVAGRLNKELLVSAIERKPIPGYYAISQSVGGTFHAIQPVSRPPQWIHLPLTFCVCAITGEEDEE